MHDMKQDSSLASTVENFYISIELEWHHNQFIHLYISILVLWIMYPYLWIVIWIHTLIVDSQWVMKSVIISPSNL